MSPPTACFSDAAGPQLNTKASSDARRRQRVPTAGAPSGGVGGRGGTMDVGEGVKKPGGRMKKDGEESNNQGVRQAHTDANNTRTQTHTHTS